MMLNPLQSFHFNSLAATAAGVGNALSSSLQALLPALNSRDNDAVIAALLNGEHFEQIVRGRSITKITRQFTSDAHRLAAPRGADRFPDVVEYSDCCMGPCRTSTPPDILRFFDRILHELSAIASTAESYSTIPLADLLLVCTQETSVGTLTSCW